MSVPRRTVTHELLLLKFIVYVMDAITCLRARVTGNVMRAVTCFSVVTERDKLSYINLGNDLTSLFSQHGFWLISLVLYALFNIFTFIFSF